MIINIIFIYGYKMAFQITELSLSDHDEQVSLMGTGALLQYFYSNH